MKDDLYKARKLFQEIDKKCKWKSCPKCNSIHTITYKKQHKRHEFRFIIFNKCKNCGYEEQKGEMNLPMFECPSCHGWHGGEKGEICYRCKQIKEHSHE